MRLKIIVLLNLCYEKSYVMFSDFSEYCYVKLRDWKDEFYIVFERVVIVLWGNNEYILV